MSLIKKYPNWSCGSKCGLNAPVPFFLFSFFCKSLQSVFCHLLGHWYNHIWVRTPFSKKDEMSDHVLLTEQEPQVKVSQISSPCGRKSATKRTSLDFSWRRQQVWRTEFIHTLNLRRCHFKPTAAWELQSGKMQPFLCRAALAASYLYNNTTALRWSVPGQLSEEAQIIMVMELIICLI